MSAPCLSRAFQVNVSGGQYILNGGSTYVAQYGIANGVYAFDNVPEAHPMAILHSGGISYSGDSNKKFTKTVDGVERTFYYGNVKVTVSSNFGTASLYCYYHGYMGGQDMLVHQSSCALTQFDDRLISNNSRYRIVCQNDANFVVYENSTGNVVFATSIKDRLWSPNQSKNLQIQDDGNFVVYDTSGGSNVPVFSTNSITATSYKSPGNSYRLSLQDDGNIVHYDIRDLTPTPVFSFNDLRNDVESAKNGIASLQSAVGSNISELTKNVANETNIYNKIYNACSTIKFSVGGFTYTGSGTFISMNPSDKVHGLYMTAAHCVMEIANDALSVMNEFYVRDPRTNDFVRFSGQDNIKAILGYDGIADVAIVKTGIDLSGTNIPLTFASTPANTGDICYMCGNPGGFDNLSFSQGHIRDNNNTDIGGYQMVPSLFITTPGIGGNSGSALVNMDGNVIGIYTFGYGGTEALGGGANLETLNKVVPDLITKALNGSSTDFRNSTTKNYLYMRATVPDGFQTKLFYPGENTFPQKGMRLTGTPGTGHPMAGVLSFGDLLLSYTHNGIEYPLGSLPGQYAYGIAAYFDASLPLTVTYRKSSDSSTYTHTFENWHVDYPELSDNPLASGLVDGTESSRENLLVIRK